MGGLRSILELGFAGVALANFWSRAVEIIKKMFGFLVETSAKFAKFVMSHLPKNLINGLGNPEQRQATILRILINLLRLFSLLGTMHYDIVIFLGYRTRRSLDEEISQ